MSNINYYGKNIEDMTPEELDLLQMDIEDQLPQALSFQHSGPFTSSRFDDAKKALDAELNKRQSSRIIPFNAAPTPMGRDLYKRSQLDAILNPAGTLDLETKQAEDELNMLRLPAQEQTSTPSIKTAPHITIKKKEPELSLEETPAEQEEKDLSDKEMEEALNRRQRNLGLLGILQGAHEVGMSIAGVKPRENYTEDLQKLVSLPVEDIKTKRESLKAKLALDLEKENHDPTSQASIIARETYKPLLDKIGLKNIAAKITDQTTAKELYDVLGNLNLNNLVSQYENAEARKQAAALMSQTAAERAEDKKENRKQDFITKASEKLQKTKEYQDFTTVQKSLDEFNVSLHQSTSAGDVGAIYNFIKALDSNSAVREAEVELSQSGMGHIAKIRTQLSRLGRSPRLITDRYITQMKNYMSGISAAAQKRYRRVADQTLKQAKSRGIPDTQFEEIDSMMGINSTETPPTQNKPSWAK